jgi:lipoic acid synthetase
VEKYYHPGEFSRLKEESLAMGFRHVESGPLVRSSYHAGKYGGRKGEAERSEEKGREGAITGRNSDF